MPKKITILIPVYNEAENIPNIHRELQKVFAQLKKYKFSILFIDDGSQDDSNQRIRELIQKNDHITLIELSRNFGKEVALTAGIDQTDADACIIMDADLQHPPDIIPQFIANWEKGYDVVATRRLIHKKQSLLKRFASYLFYKILSRISETNIVPQTTDFRLLDQKVVKTLKKFTERNRMFRGLIDWMGYETVYLDFVAPKREHGEAAYSYKQLLRLAVNSVTGFSLLPLKLAGYLGTLIVVVFGALLAYMAVGKFWLNYGGFSPMAFVVVTNSFLVGLILVCLGLIALYIADIHVETVNRPMYVIKNVIQKSDKK